MTAMRTDERPPWIDADVEPPDSRNFSSVEVYLAGALSTMPPFDKYHPGWCLPYGAQALRALGEWMPSEDETTRIDDVINDVDVDTRGRL